MASGIMSRVVVSAMLGPGPLEDVVKTNTENQGTEQIITQFLSDQLLYQSTLAAHDCTHQADSRRGGRRRRGWAERGWPGAARC